MSLTGETLGSYLARLLLQLDICLKLKAVVLIRLQKYFPQEIIKHHPYRGFIKVEFTVNLSRKYVQSFDTGSLVSIVIK
jgi:hypothetical protein